jgi:hypothetical protein
MPALPPRFGDLAHRTIGLTLSAAGTCASQGTECEPVALPDDIAHPAANDTTRSTLSAIR